MLRRPGPEGWGWLAPLGRQRLMGALQAGTNLGKEALPAGMDGVTGLRGSRKASSAPFVINTWVRI